MTELARLLWGRRARAAEIRELPDSLVRAAQPPDAPPIERAIVEHLTGAGSLLVRDADGAFSFVHRSVLEWLVAEAAAREVTESGDSAALGADEMSELMVDFCDIAGSFWHVIGLCRFEPGELDPYLPRPLRLPDDQPFVELPPAAGAPAGGVARLEA